MNIQKEWLDVIYDKLKELSYIPNNIGNSTTKELQTVERYISQAIWSNINDWLDYSFNDEWEIPKGLEEQYKQFFINILTHQLNVSIHPYTCGINSNHTDLVPRISYDSECFLVCPDCGYIQKMKEF